MRAFLSATLILTASFAGADPATGLWRTEPDRKALVSDIQITPCGTALCGTILRARNASGQEVQTPNLGKRLFWDLKPTGNGTYEGGTVWVPLLDITARASATLNGDTLTVTGCKGPVCDGQVWKRVK